MRMDEEAWTRHASPWSGYTRIAILPALVAVVWARDWLGWWVFLPLGLLIAWVWINPHVFPPPARTDRWMTRVVFGERVWLNRKAVPVPSHHERWAVALTAVSVAGLPPLAWGVWALDPGWTLAGLALTMGGKLWFCDRMVWLYADMIDADPAYRDWLG